MPDLRVPPMAEPKSFNDISSVPWANEAIENLSGRNIINGRGDNGFYPQDNVTRAEFVKMLVYGLSLNESSSALPFSDVSPEDWYYLPVMTAYSSKIVTGISSDFFGANDNITREDIFTIMYRLLKDKNLFSAADGSEKVITDYINVSDYAKPAVTYFTSHNIVSGYDDGSILPKNPATRAETAVILNRVIERVLEVSR